MPGSWFLRMLPTACACIFLATPLAHAQAPAMVPSETPAAPAALATPESAIDGGPTLDANTATAETRALAVDAADAQKAKAEADAEDQRIARLERTYETVRNLVGANHSVLTSLVVTGRRCDGPSSTLCLPRNGRLKGGVVGFVGVPILGGKPGHWFDFFPVVQTDELGAAYARFESQVRTYRGLVAKASAKQTDDAALSSYWRLAGLFERQLQADVQDDPDWKDEDAHTTTTSACAKCARQIVPRSGTLPHGTAAILLNCVYDLDQLVSRGITGGGVSAVAGLQQLEALWREYELLANRPRTGRQTYLLSLLGGAPIYESTTAYVNDALFGLGIEIGSETFRFYVGAGVRADWDHPYRPLGSWIGIGLSGQLGDNLVYGISGARAAAEGLQ